jgi:hypothetical protein
MAETATETATETAGEKTFIDSDEQIHDVLTKMLTPEEVETSEEASEETEEETQAEATETEEAPETEYTEESEEENQDDPKGVQKRINKAVRQQKEAEEKAEALEARIKKLESGEVTPTKPAADRVSESFDHDELDKLSANAEDVIDFVNDNPDGFTVHEGIEGKEQFLDSAEMRKRRDGARQTLKDIRERRKVIDQADAENAQILTAYPSLAEKDSAESKAVEQMFEMVPEFRNKPDGKRLAIELYLGKQALYKQAEPAKKTAKIGKKVEKRIEKAPDGGSPEQKAGLSNPRNNDGASKEALEAIAGGDDDALISELIKIF